MTKNIKDVNCFFQRQSCSPSIQIQINKRALTAGMMLEKHRKRDIRIREALIKYSSSTLTFQSEVLPNNVNKYR